MNLTSIRAIGTIAVLTLLTNVLGFGREVLVARAYGTSDTADAFVTAFAIVAACFLVFTASTVQSTFMPRYQEYLKSNPARAALLFQNTFLYLFLITGAIALALTLFAPQWVSFVVPGFSPEKTALTAKLLIWLAPTVVFMSTGVLLQSASHARNRFFPPALMPFMNNVLIIASLLILVPRIGITGLVIGYLLGAAGWWAITWAVRRDIFAARFKPLERNEMVGLLMVTLPLIWLLAADQASALIQKTLVSDLETGSIATLNYAARLSGLPLGIFGAAIATVFFPLLSKAQSTRNKTEIASSFRDGLAATLLIMLPVSIVFIWGADLIVKTVFERGAFDQTATQRTAAALIYYAIGMVPQAFIVYLNRAFFAAKNTRTPMIIGLISVAIHLIANVLLVRSIGYVGIALGTTIYALVYSALLMLNLRRANLEQGVTALSSLWKIALAAGLASIWLWWFPATGLVDFLLKSGGAALLYAGFLLLFKEPLVKRFVSISNHSY